jgi:hypothetical protein
MLIFVSQAPLVHASKPPTPGSGLLTRAGGLLRSLAAQGFPRLSPCVGGSSIILPRRLDTPV